MEFTTRAGAALAWLGRQGSRAIAASIFIGLALPWFAATFRPIVSPAIFCLLTLAFLRVEPAALRGEFARPRLFAVLLATVWIMAASPLVLGFIYSTVGGDFLTGDILLALTLQAAAPPITSAPAFVLILGLDGALALAALITTHAITPVTTPFFAALFSGEVLPIDPYALALRLAFFLGGSFLAARLIRRIAGPTRLADWREHMDGLNVIALFVFAVPVMGSVTAVMFGKPLLVLTLLAVAFAVTFGLMTATTLLFWPLGAVRAMSLGLSSGTRNMGLMLAVAGSLSDLVWLYFALAQFPIYLAPQLLSPLVRRLERPRLPADR
jgi:BASS family bile acid:Na+ symporter